MQLKRLSLRNEPLTVASLDQQLPAGNGSVSLDLSRVDWFEPEALLYLLSVLDKDSRLNLPQSERARDFLRRWNFFEALDEQVREDSGNLSEILGKEGDKVLRRDRDREPFPYFTDFASVNDRLEPLVSRRFAAIETLTAPPLPAGADLKTLRRAVRNRAFDGVSKWRAQIIDDTFSNRWMADSFREALVELVFNAFLHPGATRIRMLSQKRRGSKSLRVAVWNDGAGIEATLIRTLEDGLPIQRPVEEAHHRHYLVRRKPEISDAGTLSYRTSFTSTNQTDFAGQPPHDDKLLIFALFPGVSSRLTDDNQGGIGLSSSIDNIVGEHGGSIGVRSGFHHAEVTPHHGGDGADFDVTVIPQRRMFRGVLASIEVPVP